MTTGTVHTIAPDLHLVEGHHPHNLWDDPDLPTVVAHRSGRRLYLLDTGAGPEQREAIRDIATSYHDQIDEVVLLNSHGHLDHLGNNDLVSEIGAGMMIRHHIPRDARPALDFPAFFGAMYQRGLPYFDYLRGLTLPAEDLASLLRSLGADDRLSTEEVSELAVAIDRMGITPALSGFLPSIVVDILLQTYPPVDPSLATMTDYETIGAAEEIWIGSTAWTGWTFTDAYGEPDVQVLQSGGHSAGGVVFYLPRQRFMMMADETTSVPIWADSDPRRTVATARKALTMLGEGHLTSVCAGHRPMSVVTGDDARAALSVVVSTAREFTTTVGETLAAHPQGIGIDQLYDDLVAAASPSSVISMLHRLQFPVFSTFLKLTLLNHCLLLNLPQGVGSEGRPTFLPEAADA